MFTGLIEEIGVVKEICKSTAAAKMTIQASKVIEALKIGDSICTNGVCLTVTSFHGNEFTVDIMGETLRKTTLRNVLRGDSLNLERALTLSNRLGGHIVSGHIDGTGKIEALKKETNSIILSIAAPKEVLKYVLYKGSIAIDGISLTVSYVDSALFKVSIIPHTKQITTLGTKKIGEEVNLECDVIGKYIEKFLTYKENDSMPPKLDLNFLSNHGFA